MTVEAEPGSHAAPVTYVDRVLVHRDGYRSLLRLVLVQAVVIVVLVTALIAKLLLIQPERSYYASYSDGRLVGLTPLPPPAEATAP